MFTSILLMIVSLLLMAASLPGMFPGWKWSGISFGYDTGWNILPSIKIGLDRPHPWTGPFTQFYIGMWWLKRGIYFTWTKEQ